VEQVICLRKAHPGWGPKTLWMELTMDKRLEGYKIPKPSSIALLLKDEGLSKEYEKHTFLPGTALHKADYEHHIWQIDSKGSTKVEGIGRAHFINTKDVFSKTYCGCIPLEGGAHGGSPSTSDHQQALRLAFCEFGMPHTIQSDHGSVFYENKGKSPFPTRFHLWLIALNIQLIFSRVHQPKDQGTVERAHQTMTNQVVKGNSFESMLALHQYCNQRRARLNEVLPCTTTENLPPLIAFPHARFSGNSYHPRLEEELLDLDRVHQFLHKGEWFRKVGDYKTLSLGGQKYYVESAEKDSKAKITFDAAEKLLCFYDAKEQFLEKQPIKGITQEYLMGRSFFEASVPNFQLEIPFTWKQKLLSTTFLDSS